MSIVLARPPSTDALYRKVAWRLLPFLFVAYVVAYIDRSNVGFAKLAFLHDLGFSEAVFGLGGGLFYLGYSLFEVPSNLLLARTGARRTLMRIMILWSLCSVALAFMHSPAHFYVLRFLLGAAEAGFFPGVLLYLSHWVPQRRRAMFTALFMSAMPIAGVIGGPASGLILAQMDGVGGLDGWRWMFILEGAPAAALGVIAWWILTDHPSDATWLNEHERAAIADDLAAEKISKNSAQTVSALMLLRDPRLYALALMSGALIAGLAGLALWLPSVVRDAGATGPWQIGLIAAIPYGAGLITQQIVARRSDREGERRIHACSAATCGALGWIALPMTTESPIASIAALTLASAGMFAATGPFWALVGSTFATRTAPAGIAMVTTCGSVAAFVSPILVGRLNDATGTLAAGQYYYAALVLAATIAIFGALAPHNEASL